MDLVKQPELPSIGVSSGPVGHHMEVYQGLSAVFNTGHYLCPLERHKLDEHGGALPWYFLVKEFHVVVPQVDG